MTEDDLLAITAPVIDALDELGIAYHIGGSVAAMVHGNPRSTVDVDVIADFKRAHIGPFVSRLEAADYYVDAEMIREALDTGTCFNVIHLGTSLKVDVFPLKPLPFETEALSRRVSLPLSTEAGSRQYFVTSAEDIVVQKLRWYRMSNHISDRQWNDVLGVLRVNGPDLDYSHMEKWARELGVLDLLERARQEAAE